MILNTFRAVPCSSSGGQIITASGIVTLCKRPYSTVESGLLRTRQIEVYVSLINSTNVYKTDTHLRTFQSIDKNYEISS